MSEAPGLSRPVRAAVKEEPPPAYAALDLGTNNCRLLIATPTPGGFRVVEAFSRIVRLGEGLSRTGRLSEEAMTRAVEALRICAEKVKRRRVVRLKAVATQACRSAENGRDFVQRVRDETGLRLEIIPPDEEARLSVAGCWNLVDRTAEAALIVDVGGGSTELSWLDLREDPAKPSLVGWFSAPIGVVTLAERFPEPQGDTRVWFRAMVDHVKASIGACRDADALLDCFRSGKGHLIGTSGAITSLAGLHLGLPRYDRNRVDGLWMSRRDCEEAAARLIALGPEGRAAEPCIGPERADLVLAGTAILHAVQELWPCDRVRVADRGLREGLLLNLMRERKRKRGRRQRRPGRG